DQLFEMIQPRTRRKIHGAQKQGVTVREITTHDDLQQFFAVHAKTSNRARALGIFISVPLTVFEAILEHMVPKGQAVYYVAEYQSQPIAVTLNLIEGDTMQPYAAGSLHEFSKLNASSLLQWHSIQQCRVRGLRRFDLAGCTPNLPESDPRYGVYQFKRNFGGTLEKFYNAEIYLSPGVKAAQDFVRDRVWPLYQRLKR